ncbi:unnamed protein product [Agarophyton chilense]
MVFTAAFSSPLALPVSVSSGTPLTVSTTPRRQPQHPISRTPPRALLDLKDARTKQAEREAEQLQAAEDPAPGPYAYFAEQVNGRAAMMGFIIALLVEVNSGVTINSQIGLIGTATAKQMFLMVAPFIELFSRSLLHLS